MAVRQRLCRSYLPPDHMTGPAWSWQRKFTSPLGCADGCFREVHPWSSGSGHIHVRATKAGLHAASNSLRWYAEAAHRLWRRLPPKASTRR
jgi:hypothetical protein